MVNFKPIMLADSQLNSYPIKEGQLIFTTDLFGLYLDTNKNTRIKINEIILLTEEERNDLVVPVQGFYYTTDTQHIWRYDQGWVNLTGNRYVTFDVVDGELIQYNYEQDAIKYELIDGELCVEVG